MKKHFRILLLSVFFLPSLLFADDSSGNKVAATIKHRLILDIRHYYDGDSGFCDLMINMEHKNAYAVVKRVATTGDSKLCSFIKSRVKKGAKYRYDHPEKLIQIHINH
ncbi:hypothetical protein Q9X98_003221 [Vibrio parahaemolyticus]|uniref:hypothetical protein n=1 Tax=Vibrio parahaemolyticus TaxID=670 RepID=UPI001123DBB9|nr:hypothetical protein [Vibrio parahaemolyticus]EGQ8608117.1 hypothetical protein [Vibrio parahaemolyticus]EJG1534616.1 hypothetical protein [Vibrio parahaemolyticus]EKQ5901298.1 hypothetical protein [Vibrio parahaemolyticus]ELA7321617.1 hypothetical protein [Vibrio parahaemolyticus]ELA8131427.1 hypothetical protein [Vibrio parahaemolyticus]